jgi:hypothetical protein
MLVAKPLKVFVKFTFLENIFVFLLLSASRMLSNRATVIWVFAKLPAF